MRRRSTLKKLLALAAGALGGRAVAQAPAPANGGEALMAQAFAMRQRAIDSGDQAYGAVVAKGGRVVGEGVSAVRTANDSTAHAEMQAIRDALRRLGTTDLSGCELYGTSRACPMCEGAASRARIARMYHGTPVVDDGAPGSRG